ncbi:hypothetical protein DFH06DRAFT_919278, partial [Mycena polygramma]
MTFASPRKKRKIEVELPTETELDRLLIATLAAGKDDDKKRLALYGPVTQTSVPMKVTIHGSCRDSGKISAAAGAATYWGPGARLNKNGRVWGAQTGPRAELYSVVLALQSAPLHKSLEIFTRSEYIIRSIVHYAARNDACGWRCANGDLLKHILSLIKVRSAPLHMSH